MLYIQYRAVKNKKNFSHLLAISVESSYQQDCLSKVLNIILHLNLKQYLNTFFTFDNLNLVTVHDIYDAFLSIIIKVT